MRRAEEGERSEVQRLAVERWIEALESIVTKRLEAELRQEADFRQAAGIRWTEVDTT